MKKYIIIALASLACAGCVQVSGTRTADGTITISTHRFFWASEGIDFATSVKTNGLLTANLKVSKSSTDTASIAAVFTGMKELGVSAAK